VRLCGDSYGIYMLALDTWALVQAAEFLINRWLWRIEVVGCESCCWDHRE
jgi:hypothetical protein